MRRGHAARAGAALAVFGAVGVLGALGVSPLGLGLPDGVMQAASDARGHIAAATGVASAILLAALARVMWRRAERATFLRAWRESEQHARREVLHQMQMLEHAHLKSAVVEAEALLARAEAAEDARQQALLLAEVKQSLNRLRRLVVDLHSKAGQGAHGEGAVSPLPSDLEQTVQEVTRNFRTLVPGCRCEVAGRPLGAVPDAVRTALEMALYNALANAYQHGGAERVLVRLAYGLEAVTLTVQDDGRGFDVAAACARSAGRGLADLETLAVRHGGRLEIASAPGRGTTVTLRMPLARPSLGWAAAGARARGGRDAESADGAAVGAGSGGGAHPGGGRPGDRARPGERPAEPPWLRDAGGVER